MKENRTVVVGLGPVGTTLATELANIGYKPLFLLDKQDKKATKLAKQLHATAITKIEEIQPKTRLILLTVPDPEIRKVARNLSKLKLDWNKIVVIHTSGPLGPDELQPLARLGAGIVACHPYQTFPRQRKITNLQDVTFGITGNSRGIAEARKLVKAMGGQLLLVSPEKRTLYHLSAVFASGCIATDLWMSTHILQSLGITKSQAQKVLYPITLRTVLNAFSFGTEAAVTGPAVRKDMNTVKKHLRALKKEFPEFAEAYREMSKVMSGLSDKVNKIKSK